jgi:hypothetical protein
MSDDIESARHRPSSFWGKSERVDAKHPDSRVACEATNASIGGAKMSSFSERYGLKPRKTVLQVDSMDSDLRTGLWNAWIVHCWSLADGDILSWEDEKALDEFVKTLWGSYYKLDIDALPSRWTERLGPIKARFFSCKWYEVYDFIEFVAKNFPDREVSKRFKQECNSVLKRELSAYRFVGDKVLKITSEREIAAVEKALADTEEYEDTNTHLNRALELLSDRKSPDYRNSMKESISAVEAMCRKFAKDEKATLGDALKELKHDFRLHRALEEAFLKLYGYTNDAEGIRHALLDEPNLDYEDAMFMLVTCSAFISYLKAKLSKSESKT